MQECEEIFPLVERGKLSGIERGARTRICLGDWNYREGSLGVCW